LDVKSTGNREYEDKPSKFSWNNKRVYEDALTPAAKKKLVIGEKNTSINGLKKSILLSIRVKNYGIQKLVFILFQIIKPLSRFIG
jgi:hypothetical protein